ncbi:hypothetical protein ACFFX0_31470 [Citricoccus parietis]|uniref:Uncharacterized protein n=1 Tax=Citricoccus parietis TaxID=592307 RepID=A0ABV5G918_9MICC
MPRRRRCGPGHCLAPRRVLDWTRPSAAHQVAGHSCGTGIPGGEPACRERLKCGCSHSGVHRHPHETTQADMGLTEGSSANGNRGLT